MASLDQSSIAGSEETRHYFESLATDVENIHQERVGKGYKRCPKCSTVQGSSYAKCPKCDHAFTSKGAYCSESSIADIRLYVDSKCQEWRIATCMPL